MWTQQPRTATSIFWAALGEHPQVVQGLLQTQRKQKHPCYARSIEYGVQRTSALGSRWCTQSSQDRAENEGGWVFIQDQHVLGTQDEEFPSAATKATTTPTKAIALLLFYLQKVLLGLFQFHQFLYALQDRVSLYIWPYTVVHILCIFAFFSRKKHCPEWHIFRSCQVPSMRGNKVKVLIQNICMLRKNPRSRSFPFFLIPLCVEFYVPPAASLLNTLLDVVWISANHRSSRYWECLSGRRVESNPRGLCFLKEPACSDIRHS